MHVLEIVSLTSLAFWVLLTLDRKRSWPRELVLPSDEGPSSGKAWPEVVALVPARNEAEILPETLPSLLGQEGIRLRVFLIDDGSTDGTAEVARSLAGDLEGNVDLEIVRATSRPAGWSGKVHALSCGYQRVLAASGQAPKWLLLTDADIRHRPGSILSLVHQAHSAEAGGPFDMVSIMVRLEAVGLWERLVIPAFVFFFQLLYPFRRVADRQSRVAAAAGGCVLVRGSALEKAGGFARIADEIIDDVALARAVKSTGGNLWLGLDPGIVSRRRYRGLGGLWHMVSRTAFTQLGFRWSLLGVTLVALGILVVFPPIALVAGLTGFWMAGPLQGLYWLRAALWALLAWTLGARMLLPSVRHHRLSWLYAVTLPVAGLLFGLMTVDSALRDLVGRGPNWRGRAYASSRDSESPPTR